jgi:hypothetical protein
MKDQLPCIFEGLSVAFYDKVTESIPNLTSERIIEASSRQVAIMMAAANMGIALIGESMRSQCPKSTAYVPLTGMALS